MAMAWIAISWFSLSNTRTGPVHTTSQPLPPNKGLDERILHSFPRVTYNAETTEKLAECAICLTEFINGDEVRVLPQCSHGFHLNCIDEWLKRCSSCPLCRDVLMASFQEGGENLPATQGFGAESADTDGEEAGIADQTR